MDILHSQLLACLRAFLNGQRAPVLEGMTDWQALRTLAGHHKLEAVVYSALSQDAAFCGGDRAMISSWRQRAYAMAMHQTRKDEILFLLIRELDVPWAVVKGYVCRSLYPQPELRVSADEDIYINKEDYPRFQASLALNGFACAGGDPGDVTHWFHADTGMHIELHARLLEDDRENALFENFVPVPLDTPQGTLCTLPPEQHLAFLVCHARKHLITGGVGIRTLCDIALFYRTYRSQMDDARLEQLLEALSCKPLFLHILAIGREALDIPCSREDIPPMADPLLTDVLEAGIYGQSTLTRHHSGTYTAQQAKGRSSLLRTLFPSREALMERYPVLKDHPGRLPLVWLRRLGRYTKEITSQSDSSPSQSLLLGKKRLEMLVKYDIISKNQRKIS